MSQIIAKLNQIQASSHTLWLKFHNFHWNARGLEFFALHAFTQKAYENMAEIFDEMAERALQIGGKALIDLKDLENLSKAKIILNSSFNALEILSNLKQDYEFLLNEFKDLNELAENEKDLSTQGLAQDFISKFEKEIWMLNQALKSK